MDMITPSRHIESPMLTIVRIVLRRLRQEFLRTNGKYRNMCFYLFYATRFVHELFMQEALDLARQAGTAGEVPVGAVVVVNGVVTGRGVNSTVARNDPTAHAEVLALREAAQAAGNYRLEEATVYATLEPCAMCAGALVAARVKQLVFGARDLRFGGVRSKFRIADSDLLNHRVEIVEGVLAAECVELLQRFFEARR
jgi:tRNA(adenine34) deaminase